MKTDSGVGAWYHSFKISARERRVVTFTPWSLYAGGRALDTHWLGDCVAPEMVWTLWRRGKYFSTAGNPITILLPFNPTPSQYTDLYFKEI
jgi:hypothetical protein